MTNREKIFEYKDIIYKLYSIEGRNKSYISRLLEIDRKTLSRIINYEWELKKAQKKHLTPSNEKFLKKNKNRIIKLIKEDFNIKEIAEDFKVSYSFMKNIIKYDENIYKLLKKKKEDKKRENLLKSSLTYDFKNLENEIWVPLKSNPKKYMISNKGRFKSFKKKYNKFALLKPFLNEKVGYYYMTYYLENGKRKNANLGRLVAHHFCKGFSKENNTVNHKDGNKLNNEAENLEWVSQSLNNKHSYKVLKRKTNKVNQYNVNIKKYIYQGIYEFKTLRALAKFLNKSETQVRRYLKNSKKYDIEVIYKK